VALAHDGGIFGRQLAGGVEQAAVDQGLEVTAVERVEPNIDEAEGLAQRLAEESPDVVIYLGIGGDAAATMLAAMADAELVGRPLVAAAPLARPGALPAGEPERALPIVSPILPTRAYPAKGRRILARLARGEDERAPIEALYGYESMRVVLAAVRAAGRRARDRAAVVEAAREQGPRDSVIGAYGFDRRGDTSRRPLALYELVRGRLQYRGSAPGSAR
jgi:branched-chain amino acid transport system substrate-binding protein